MSSSEVRWMVLNQSQPPAFQKLLEDLAGELGRCVLYTGMPHPGASDPLTVVRGPSYDRRSKAKRALSWLAFLAGAVAQVARVPRGAVLLACTNPPFLVHLVWLAARLRGQPYVLLVWDLYPDHIVRMRWLGEGSPVVRLWLALNRRAFRDAVAVVTLGDGMREAVLRQLGPDAATARVVVIPNWADTATIRPQAKEANPFARDHGQVGKLTVIYSGNLGATHGAASIAAVADALRDDPRIAFLVVGEGLDRPKIEAEARRRGLTNLTLLGSQPWEALPASLATGDIALVSQARGTEHLSVPSKTYSALAAGSALVALTSPESDLGRLVRDRGVGVVCAQEDPAAIARAIRGLADDPEELARLRAKARRVAEEEFCPEVARRNFAEVLAPAFARKRVAREAR